MAPLPGPAAAQMTSAPRNNFTFVMLVAAALVAVRHSAILLGPEAATAPLATMPAAGVFVLFAVSGYLVAGSWQRRPNAGGYVVDRAARILPGLIVVVVCSALALGPLTTTLTVSEYVRHPLTWEYLLNILLNPQYALPGVFAESPVSVAVNGTLWSIPAQVAAYMMIPLVGMIPNRTVRAVIWIVLAIGTASLSLAPVSSEIVVWGSQLAQVCNVVPCFFVGAALRELPGDPKLWVGVVAALAYAAALSWVPQLLHLAGWTLLPLAAIALGRASFPLVRSAGRWGNPSFGIFLTGFPIQQALIDGYGTSHAWVSLGLTLVLSVAFGSILLVAVEQPVLTVVHSWTRRASIVGGVDVPPSPEPAPRLTTSEPATVQVVGEARG